jgi:hypothetical protein
MLTQKNRNVILTMRSINKIITINKYEEIFLNLLDILFLCLGFYPYIKKIETAVNNEKTLYVRHTLSSKYKEGNSYAHWSSIVTSISSTDLKESYPIFKSMLKQNQLIIKTLTNAIHSSDIFIDSTLSILIQCVEGYMRQWHPNKKYSDKIKNSIISIMISSLNDMTTLNIPEDTVINKDELTNSIKGLLGYINESSLRECLREAFNMNKYTKMILRYQIKNDEYNDFIKKSKGTRNQFSHMSPQSKVFENLEETIMAKDKYLLLIRLLMLNDMKIKITDISALKSNINSIDDL